MAAGKQDSMITVPLCLCRSLRKLEPTASALAFAQAQFMVCTQSQTKAPFPILIRGEDDSRDRFIPVISALRAHYVEAACRGSSHQAAGPGLDRNTENGKV